MISTGSIFKNFFVPKAVDLDSKQFQDRLSKLEDHITKSYTVEKMPNGWKCTPKVSTQPGYVITPESVLFVMKNLGI